MFLVSLVPQMPAFLEAVVDATLLLVLIFPVLYFWELKPLGKTIFEREQAEIALCSARDQMDKLNQELKMLSEMSGYLQACNTTEEAYSVIVHSAKGLFENTMGGLFVYNSSHNELAVQNMWGGLQVDENSCVFPPQDCWALRRGRAFQSGDDHIGAPCRHLPDPPTGQTLCVPIVAYGEMLGVLYIHGNYSKLSEKNTPKSPSLDKGLGSALAEQAGLALANLGLRESLRNQSIRDQLTGLFNRRYLEETLERELQRAKRANASLAVVLCDLDHFKCFNDEFGHDAGDFLLRELGALLRKEFRGSDIACRFGGEEFVLILPEISPELVMERMETFRLSIKSMAITFHEVFLGTVTISGGVAIFPKNGTTPEVLFKSADKALYIAKNTGRDQFVMAAPL